MAATQGHTQSLHTNALDEALALPTDFSARIARNTQLLLQQESGTDPGHRPVGRQRLRREAHPRPGRAAPGSTSRRSRRPAAWPRPSTTGIPKLRIEEAAARTQARIDSGRQPVIGVNKYRVEADEQIDVLQGRQLRRCAPSRSRSCGGCARSATPAPCRTRWAADRRRRRRPRDGRAAARRATCWSWRSTPPAPRRRSARSPTRWRRCTGGTPARSVRSPACTATRQGAPHRGADPPRWPTRSSEAEGRRPRILVAKMGQDGHDRGQKVIATAFADLGFDVDVGPLFQTPAEVARQAVEADVHIVGVSLAGRRAPHAGARRCARSWPR